MERKKEKAKAVKIETFYAGALAVSGDRLRGICPFHKDAHTPNFFIYTKTNTWFCFMEGVGGDSIAYMMRLKNLDFKDAVTTLLNAL